MIRMRFGLLVMLAGVIGGLISQELRPYEAACAGVYIHTLAGEMASHDTGDAGMLASDLLTNIPGAMRTIKSSPQPSQPGFS